MSQSTLQSHLSSNGWAYVVVIAFVLVIIGIGYTAELNDQEYFKTLDKFTCEEIWTMMTVNGFDFDTTNYYGNRC